VLLLLLLMMMLVLPPPLPTVLPPLLLLMQLVLPLQVVARMMFNKAKAQESLGQLKEADATCLETATCAPCCCVGLPCSSSRLGNSWRWSA
jgi:hypothetical protein